MESNQNDLKDYDLNREDLKQIEHRNISPAEIIKQLDTFKQGIPHIKLDRPATVGDGIRTFTPAEHQNLLKQHRRAVTAGQILKFVPASGAATRMFKSLSKLLNLPENFDFTRLKKLSSAGNEDAAFGIVFFQNIRDFAFYPALNRAVTGAGLKMDELLQGNALKTVLEFLLTDKGLGYAGLPKGLIEFHPSGSSGITPFREHIAESLEYAQDAASKVRLHFTVTEKHRPLIQKHIDDYTAEIRITNPALQFDIEYSVQKKSTDTIAANPDNQPFRDDDGNLLFRPAGHGALIENLNELDPDIIIINNIDNVRTERLRSDTYLYKKLLCGYLVELQTEIFKHLAELEKGISAEDILPQITAFVENTLTAYLPDDFDNFNSRDKISCLYHRLNRPFRVCGMVKNQGDPGGGPFWVRAHNGEITLQIVEMSQINHHDPDQLKILESSTHFNPVDMACAVKNHRGVAFNLLDYIDETAAFITIKSLGGRELKALERPGLWNGAMAGWNTVFVEVPITTFSPVKTVNDLLKKEHRS